MSYLIRNASNLFFILGVILQAIILYLFYKFDILSKLYYAKYFIALSICVILGCITLLFLDFEKKRNMMLFIITSLFMVYVIEGVLYFFNFPESFNHPDYRSEIALQQGVVFDKRTVKEIIADEKEMLWPNFFPNLVIPERGVLLSDGERKLPLAGLSNEKIVFCNESGNYVLFKPIALVSITHLF